MNWKTLVKIVVTVLLIAVIFRSVDLGFFAETLFSISPSVIVVVVLGYILGQVISTLKWRVFVIAGGLSVSILEALKAYFIGMFVNCFGLGMVGGDMVRGMLVVGEGESRSLGVTSVVADRLHGLAVLAAIGGLSAVIFQPDFLDSYLLGLLVSVGGLVVCGWMLGPHLVGVLVSEDTTLGQKLRDCTGMLSRDPGVLIRATILSVAFHLLQISLHWVMAEGLGAEIPFVFLLTTVPFINILSSLPISWNGVGVREAGYLFFFTQLHPFLTTEQAVVMGALWLLGVTTASALGGIIAFASKEFSFELLKKRTPLKA